MLRSSYTSHVSAVTADWLLLGTAFYRKTQLYSMNWGQNMDLSNYMVATCPFGGPIALIRNDRKLMVVNPGAPSRGGASTQSSVAASAGLIPTVYIYTSAGKLLHSFAWTRPRLVKMAWTENERLITCCEDGSVAVYDVFGEIVTQFSLGLTTGLGVGLRTEPDAHIDGGPGSPAVGKNGERLVVLDCKMSNAGLVAMVGPRPGQRRDVASPMVVGSPNAAPGPAPPSPNDVLNFVVVTDITAPRPKVLPTIPAPHTPTSANPPHSWTLIPPHLTPSRTVEVLVAVGSTLFLVDPATAADQLLAQHGPFMDLAVSANGKFLSLYTRANRVWVVSTDFTRNLCLWDSGMTGPPDSMGWCGTDAVVLAWNGGGLIVSGQPGRSRGNGDSMAQRQGKLVLLGPAAESVTLTYDPPSHSSSLPATAIVQPSTSIHLVPEVDSVRVITSDTCEILGKVPAATEEVFRIGGTGPAAILYDALESFERKSPKADDLVRSIRPDLARAIDTLVEAAAHDFDPAVQKALLKAASFGKCFLDGGGPGGGYNPERFVDTCRTVRVLNAARDEAGPGMAITYGQYTRLTPEVLVDRLVGRRLHLLALRVCEYLAMSGERVVVHWARTKIRRGKEDEDKMTRALVERLTGVQDQYPGLAYADIAKEAFRAGMAKLATRLLDFEPHASHAVPLLISMGSDQVALAKAVQSGDTDLVHLALLHLRRKLPAAEFFRAVAQQPAAGRLLEVYARRAWEVGGEDAGLLKDYLYQDDRRGEGADVVVMESLREQEVSARIPLIRTAAKLYAEDRDLVFEARACEEEAKLLQLQEALERELGRPFVDATVSETIYRLLVMGQAAKAGKVRADFKVGDRRFWWLRLRSLVRTSAWEELDKFSRVKSPIGYAPFVDECLKVGARAEAAKYVDRVEPADLRAQYKERVRGY